MIATSNVELVASLHTRPDVPFQAQDGEHQTSLIFTVFVMAALCGTFQNVVFNILKTIFYKHYREKRKMFLKTAYQITNMTVNLGLGGYGIYHFFFSLPAMDAVPITERIAGFKEFSIFGAIQVGYNAWALPIGYYFMDEPISMLAHHIAVLCVGSISCFGSYGFRYHAPFFFGVIEISSVPLSIMNFCKNNKELVDGRFPKLFLRIRVIFVVIFLTVRVIMWTPLIKDVLFSSGLLAWTCETNACRIGVGSFWLSSFFLTLLQFYWAVLIIKAVAQISIKTTSKDKVE